MSYFEHQDFLASREEDRREAEADAIEALGIAAHKRLTQEFIDTLHAGPRTLLDLPGGQGRYGPRSPRAEPVGDYLCGETVAARFDELLSILCAVAAGHEVPPARAQAWIDVAAKEFADNYADDVAQAEFDAGPDRDDFDVPERDL